jgi:small multidrug resistance pump
MAWVYLCVAILLEVAGTTSMKLSDGFTRPLPSFLILVFYCGSLVFLTLALKSIDISVAYAVWSGMGIFIITLIGVFYFGERMTLLKIVALVFIIVGVTVLNFTEHRENSPGHPAEENPAETVNNGN